MSTHVADRLGKWLAIGAGALVVVAVVLAIRTIGTPMQQRQVRIDERRVQDLDNIDRAVRSWSRRNDDRLPETLAPLASQPGTKLVLLDPEGRGAYEYRRVDKDRFEVCAVFTTDTKHQTPETYPANWGEWAHGAGRHCFTRKRDPEDAAKVAAGP